MYGKEKVWMVSRVNSKFVSLINPLELRWYKKSSQDYENTNLVILFNKLGVAVYFSSIII